MTPTLIYGTAWKKDRTKALVEKAISCGFRAIDTANQPKHYNEPGLGEALRASAKAVPRASLWLQTKFTPADGHDSRIPYDRTAPLSEQVRQSFESSLEHLGTDYVDSYLLHGPYSRSGLSEEDWEVWRAIGEIHRSGRAKAVGVSNVSAAQLEALAAEAEVKPMVVQDRCFAQLGWNRATRAVARKHGILYQGFSLLTANPFVLSDPRVLGIAERLDATPEQTIFSFCRQAGMIPLTGTTDETHMMEDLAASQLVLTADEVAQIESIAG